MANQLKVMSFNTHLMGAIVGGIADIFGEIKGGKTNNYWKDDERFEA